MFGTSSALRLTVIVLVSLLGIDGVADEAECVVLVDQFLQRRFPSLLTEPQPTTPPEYHSDDFVFFLHVPRTAGRSFFSCFLHKAYPPEQRCAKSYDSLRLELSRPDCKLLASHDDYSISDFLPENFKVITQARDPVDRVISAYEFATLVSARDFSPNVTDKPEASDKVKTRDVWPWLYLIQLFDRYLERSMALLFKKHKLMKEQQPERYEASLDSWVQAISTKSGKRYFYHRGTRESKWNLTDDEKQRLLPMADPFNNSLTVPLTLFVEFPMADELVNNAMTYQVLGLSNASYWEDAPSIRECSVYSRAAQEKLLEAAKAQMDRMLHISLTHKLDESLHSIAATLKLGLTGPTFGGVPVELAPTDEEETKLTLEDCRHNLTELTDQELLQLLFKHRSLLDDSRSVARSRRKSKLSKAEFLPKWDSAVSNLEDVRVIQAEVLKRRKEKGDKFTDYPEINRNESKILKYPLWHAYQRCVNATVSKSGISKVRSMSNLALPDERRIYFTKAARTRIPQSTVDLIKEKNWMDVQLYEHAVKLYDEYLRFQKDKGLLEPIPEIKVNDTENLPPTPPEPPEPVLLDGHDEL